MTELAGRVCLGLSLIIIVLCALVVNSLVLVVWSKTEKIRTAQYYFWINLAIVDILAACMWTSLSVSAVIGDSWVLPDVMCNIHSYFSSFCNLINTHSLIVLALERSLKFFKPSKHEDICIRFFVILLICGLWFFDGVVCVFSAVQWAWVRYYPAQFQCIPEYQLSVSHMNFMFTISHGILLLVMLLCYPACFIKVFHMRSRVQPSGALVLEINTGAKGDSYSERMKRCSEMFQNAGMKSKKPKLEPTYNYTRDGYTVSSETDDRVTPGENRPKFKKKQYSMAKEDYSRLKVYAIVSLSYVSLWIPYVIASYVWTYSRYTPIPAGVVTFFVWLTHCGLFVKPLIYGLCLKKFREALVIFLKRRK